MNKYSQLMTLCRLHKGWFTKLGLLFFVVIATCGNAQAVNSIIDTIETKPVSVSKSKSAWDNFVPPRDTKFDWIQLKSGEWLKGELKALYNFVLEFDSDELDLLKFDWEDIKQIRSAGLLQIRLERIDGNGRPFILIGTLILIDDKTTITVGNTMREFDHAQIVSMAKGAEREIDLWTGKISLGANIRSGNSDLVDASFLANVKRRRAKSRFVMDYVGNFSRAEKIETSNNHRIKSYYDIFITTKFFWRTIVAEYFRDTFKNLDHQVTAGTTIGYHFIRTSRTKWEVTGGIGGLYKRFVSVEPGKDIDNASPALAFGTKYDTKLTKWLEYLFDFNFQIVDEESGTYIHHLITTLESDLVGDLDLDISFIWDYVQDPQPEADGTVPEKDDFRFVIGIGYEF